MDGLGGRYVVVGGGLLGTHTAALLASDGTKVTIFSRSFTPWLDAQLAAGLDIDTVEGSIPPGPHLADQPELGELIDGADGVFVFAGSSTPALSASDPAASATASVIPSLSVLELVRRSSCRRLVLASSGGTVYGKPSRVPTPEDEPTLPISVHGMNSLAIEMYASYYERRHGLEPIVLRFSNVYGPGERTRYRQGVIAAWCSAIARGDPLVLIGSGETRRDFIYASDAAAAAVAAMRSVAGAGTFNVGACRSYSLDEVIELLAEVSGQNPKIERKPGDPVDVPFTELDSSKLQEATGWEPQVDLREGLTETLGWTIRTSTES